MAKSVKTIWYCTECGADSPKWEGRCPACGAWNSMVEEKAPAKNNWIVAGQPDGRRLNVIKSFYVKFERKIPEVVADFCTYYASHRNKTVVYYYDATALGSNYAVNEQDFRWVVVHD